MKVLDLFSGIGGLHMDYKKVWNKKIYNDVKEITKQRYSNQMEKIEEELNN